MLPTAHHQLSLRRGDPNTVPGSREPPPPLGQNPLAGSITSMSHEGSVTLTPRLLPMWSAASLGRWHVTENCVSFPETHLLGHLLDHPRQEVLLCLPGKGPAEGNHVIKTERGIEMQRSQTRISPSLSRREGQGTGTTEKRARFPCRSLGGVPDHGFRVTETICIHPTHSHTPASSLKYPKTSQIL